MNKGLYFLLGAVVGAAAGGAFVYYIEEKEFKRQSDIDKEAYERRLENYKTFDAVRAEYDTAITPIVEEDPFEEAISLTDVDAFETQQLQNNEAVRVISLAECDKLLCEEGDMYNYLELYYYPGDDWLGLTDPKDGDTPLETLLGGDEETVDNITGCFHRDSACYGNQGFCCIVNDEWMYILNIEADLDDMHQFAEPLDCHFWWTGEDQ